MKLSELATCIQNQIRTHGDVAVFDSEFYSVIGVTVSEAEPDQFDLTWNMPKMYAQIQVLK